MKKIKYLFMSLVVFVCFLSPEASASASNYSTGKAVMPFYYEAANGYVNYYISNITDAPIDVIITYYNSDGTLATDDNNSSTGRIKALNCVIDNYSEVTADTSLTFTLGAHKTIMYQLAATTTTYYGYGVIQWKQSGTALQGLIATCRQGAVSTGAWSEELINGGLPF